LDNDLAQLVTDFYDARRRGDVPAIRRILADDVVWHEPPLNDVTGDLLGPDAVLRMMQEAQARTAGTFLLRVDGILTNRTHAVALVHWTADVGGQTLSGSEFAVFRIQSRRISEVWFFQQDSRIDQAFWGVSSA
jgi:ketosteroid isomerase-like protein